MNPLLETLNAWGERGIAFALPMLLQSSLLIVLVFQLDVALRKRVSAGFRSALWLLLLVKLVLPPSLALPTGIGYWIGRTTERIHPPRTAAQIRVTYPDRTPRAAVDAAAPATAPVPSLGFGGLLALGWLAGSVALLVILLRRGLEVRNLVRQSEPASEDLRKLLADCRQHLRLRRAVQLRISSHAFSPALCGLLRPVVLLPEALIGRLNRTQLRAVLLHELMHLRRRDLWVNHTQALLQIAYWWHPLLWLANARLRRVREEAVDEAVMAALHPDSEIYPETLMEVAKAGLTPPRLSLGLVGIIESRSALRQRIELAINRISTPQENLRPSGLVAIVLIAALVLPMGCKGPANNVRQEVVLTNSTFYAELNQRPRPAQKPRPFTLEEATKLLRKAGYRPNVTYGFDDSFMTYFGSEGVKIINQAATLLRTESRDKVGVNRTRVYKVESEEFLKELAKHTSNETRLLADAELRDIVRLYFERAGVKHENAQRIIFDRTAGKVIVSIPKEEEEEEALWNAVLILQPLYYQQHQKPPERQQLEVSNAAPHIMIESRFVELPARFLAELRMGAPTGTWTNGSSVRLERGQSVTANTNQLSYWILSPQHTVELIRQIQQKDGADVLSAPRVTTLDGRQAQVMVVEVRSIKGLEMNIDGVGQVECGPKLDVLPRMTPDRSGIDMTLIASVKEFLGYAPSDKAPIPHLRTRQFQTRVTVKDGETVLLGGVALPANAPKDAKSLIVLVTANLVDAKGEPIRK